MCHFHRLHKNAENGGPKTCTSGTNCRFVHATDEKQYAEKLKAERKGKGTRGNVGTTSSGFLLAAALSAALPNVAGSTAVTSPFMLVAGREAELSSSNAFPTRGFPGPQWMNEVFTDIDAPNSFLDWDSQLNVAARPSIFFQALDPCLPFPVIF